MPDRTQDREGAGRSAESADGPGAGGDPPVEEFTLDRVGELALHELGQRLSTGAEKIPGTGLLQLANTWLKMKEREEARREAAAETAAGDLLDSLASLPPERQRGLLGGELERARERVTVIEDRLEALKED